jgi:hypothetical protein
MSLQTGGARGGRDLDEVEVGLLREPEGVVDTDDPDGLAVGANEPDFRHPDPVVDAQLCADGSSMWSERCSVS